jgi:hypothetical protein
MCLKPKFGVEWLWIYGGWCAFTTYSIDINMNCVGDSAQRRVGKKSVFFCPLPCLAFSGLVTNIRRICVRKRTQSLQAFSRKKAVHLYVSFRVQVQSPKVRHWQWYGYLSKDYLGTNKISS